MNFTKDDWIVVGLLTFVGSLRVLYEWNYYDPFGEIMEIVGGFIGAYVFVYIAKWLLATWRKLPAE